MQHAAAAMRIAAAARRIERVVIARAFHRLRSLERETRPTDPEVEVALARRYAELPAHARTPSQLLGRRTTGCEGTHGVFPRCTFACRPCYHSRLANAVRVRRVRL